MQHQFTKRFTPKNYSATKFSALSIGSGAILASIVANNAHAQSINPGFKALEGATYQVLDGNLILSTPNGIVNVTSGAFQVIEGQLFVSESIFNALNATAATAAQATAVAAAAASSSSILPIVGGAAALTAGVALAVTSSTDSTAKNNAPTVTNASLDKTIAVGSSYSYTLPTNNFTDADNDTLNYSATLSNGDALPNWLTFDTATRTLSGTPPSSSSGQSLDIKITANDGKGGSVSDSFQLTLAADTSTNNNAPVIANAIADASSVIGAVYNFQMPTSTFTDADNDTLTYTATLADGSALPSWLTFNADTRTFSGTPTSIANLDIKVTANDGKGGTVSDTFTLNLTAAANHAPTVANAIADSGGVKDVAYNFQIPNNSFADADNDTLTYSATLADGSALPSWLSFNADTHTFSGTPTTTSNIDIKVTVSDGKGGTVDDVFKLNIAASPSATPTINNTKLAYSEAENGSANKTVFTAAGDNITSWTLEGDDAGKFTIDQQGNVKLTNTGYDFETAGDKDGDNVYKFTVKGTASDGQTATKAFTVNLTDVTELPSYITSTNYVSTHDGIKAILSNDNEQNHWASLGATNTNVTLTYSFQTIGAQIAPDPNKSDKFTVTQEYTDSEKAFIRSVFVEYAKIANITFNEITSNEEVKAGGADIRITKGTKEELGQEADVLGFAFQPRGDRTDDASGNFFLNSSALTSKQDFSSPYGDEKNTISHELGHALGLDHPFNDNTTGNGFNAYDSTTTTGANRAGVTTGGAQDTPLADDMLESIMTYYNGYVSNFANETKVTPWKAGTIDIAALQHLYGANMSTNAGDSTYAYNQNTPIFETIWDGGGTDVITHTGTNASIINLNDGEFSHIGKTPGAVWSYTNTDQGYSADTTFQSVTLAQPSDGTVVIAEDRKSFTIVQNMEIGGVDKQFTYTMTAEGFNPITRSQDVTGYVKNDDGSINPHGIYNIGIAHGVTIENATGGEGIDTIIGNEANNIIIGNGGNDILSGNGGNDTITGGSGNDVFTYRNGADALTTGFFGNDTITDFTSGQDVIQIQNSISASDVNFTNGVLNLGQYGSITLDSVTNLTAGTDYVFVS